VLEAAVRAYGRFEDTVSRVGSITGGWWRTVA
jgi:hypothetical protein